MQSSKVVIVAERASNKSWMIRLKNLWLCAVILRVASKVVHCLVKVTTQHSSDILAYLQKVPVLCLMGLSCLPFWLCRLPKSLHLLRQDSTAFATVMHHVQRSCEALQHCCSIQQGVLWAGDCVCTPSAALPFKLIKCLLELQQGPMWLRKGMKCLVSLHCLLKIHRPVSVVYWDSFCVAFQYCGLSAATDYQGYGSGNDATLTELLASFFVLYYTAIKRWSIERTTGLRWGSSRKCRGHDADSSFFKTSNIYFSCASACLVCFMLYYTAIKRCSHECTIGLRWCLACTNLLVLWFALCSYAVLHSHQALRHWVYYKPQAMLDLPQPSCASARPVVVYALRTESPAFAVVQVALDSLVQSALGLVLGVADATLFPMFYVWMFSPQLYV